MAKTDPDQWKGGLIIRHETESALPPQHEAFVEAYVKNGGNAAAAAVAAGYDQSHGKVLVTNHKVREAIELKRDIEIKTTGATKAWEVMQSLLTDPAAPAQVRFQAARWTLESSGHGLSAVAAALQLGMGSKKQPHEMSASELAEIVERGTKQLESMRQAAKLAEKTIDVTPTPPSNP